MKMIDLGTERGCLITSPKRETHDVRWQSQIPNSYIAN
jgi:hypothetical protein